MKILRDALGSVLFHAQLSVPNECCGILLNRGDEPSVVDMVVWGSNTQELRPESRYELDHASHLEAVRIECADSGSILGYYHSHPGGESRPSMTDLDQAVEGVTYLISGMKKGEVAYAAWHIEDGEFVQESIEVR